MSNTLDLDEVLFLEESFYQKGIEEGSQQGQDIGSVQGKLHGLEKGYELGRKLGFIKGVCDTLLNLKEKQRDIITERIVKNINSILKIIEGIPDNNDYELDYESITNQLDSKLKSILMNLEFDFKDTPIKKKVNQLNY